LRYELGCLFSSSAASGLLVKKSIFWVHI
jgi:hypothetical protein